MDPSARCAAWWALVVTSFAVLVACGGSDDARLTAATSPTSVAPAAGTDPRPRVQPAARSHRSGWAWSTRRTPPSVRTPRCGWPSRPRSTGSTPSWAASAATPSNWTCASSRSTPFCKTASPVACRSTEGRVRQHPACRRPDVAESVPSRPNTHERDDPRGPRQPGVCDRRPSATECRRSPDTTHHVRRLCSESDAVSFALSGAACPVTRRRACARSEGIVWY